MGKEPLGMRKVDHTSFNYKIRRDGKEGGQ